MASSTEQIDNDDSQLSRVIYTSEKNGDDESGEGTMTKPLKTPLQVYTSIIFLLLLFSLI
jgi:hypothetical protein